MTTHLIEPTATLNWTSTADWLDVQTQTAWLVSVSLNLAAKWVTLWSECLCPLPLVSINILKPYPQADDIWRRDLWKDLLDHKDGASMNGTSAW